MHGWWRAANTILPCLSGLAIAARRVFLFAVLLLLLTACGSNPDADALHRTADSLIAAGRPDSALALLESYDSLLDNRKSSTSGFHSSIFNLQSSTFMRHELLRARAMNKSYTPFTTDSTMLAVADWYDRHGTPNERMEAHYLLGCAYRDMGEAPRAVDCYLDAAAYADTTAEGCDFHTLGCIYSQMAELYHRQLLLSYEIDSEEKSSQYFFLAKDTANAIFEMKMAAGTMILMNKKDSAEILLNEAMRLYRKHGYLQEELQTSTMLMHIYCNKPGHEQELKHLIDKYDNNCIYIDSLRLPPSSLRQYYSYKGKYYEKINMLDSAEYYYRMIYRPGISFAGCDPMYSGLLSVFKKKRNPDSIAKYAQLYCEVNDSSIAKKDQEITAQMAASYNYSNYQKKSAENAKKANDFQSYVIALLVAVIICLVMSAILLHLHNLAKQEKRRIIERTKIEIGSLTREHERKLFQLQQLEASHKKRIETILKELGNAKERNKGLLSKNKESQEIIAKLNTQFEEERDLLLREISDYADKVSDLERQLRISAYKKNSIPFLKLGIVSRIKKYYTKEPNKMLSEDELKALVDATNDYFPDLISDLTNASGISSLGIHVCILVAINIQPGDIVHLLDISSAQVGNIKKDVNNALFGENTARTLYKNLVSRYKIMSS